MKVGFKWSNITVEERVPNFLDLGFVFKILMRNGSRFRIESMHLECGMPNKLFGIPHSRSFRIMELGKNFNFGHAVITFLPGP